jgi:predicted TIM-barrel fold metal-dependent hydrolase
MPAVDSHAHAFDLSRQGWGGDRGFDIQPNELGTAPQFLHMLASHGFTHGVLINPLGGYGANNTYMLEAIAASGGRLKGVALLPDATPEPEIHRMVEGGIVGIRFNLDFPTSPPLLGPAGERALARAREVGWFIQLHYHHGDSLLAVLPTLRAAKLPVVIDHCGRPDLAGGLDQPGFRALLELGRSSDAIIKLSGIFRFSGTDSPYADTDPHVAALVEAFGIDRCIWGSDWPFLRARARTDFGPLLAALHRVMPSAAEREKVLWTNPARLFRMAPVPAGKGRIA